MSLFLFFSILKMDTRFHLQKMEMMKLFLKEKQKTKPNLTKPNPTNQRK